MSTNLVIELIYVTLAVAAIWGMICGVDMYRKFNRYMIIRRLRAIHEENKRLWDYEETEELPDLYALIAREKELENETEELLIKLGLDPKELMTRYKKKSRSKK